MFTEHVIRLPQQLYLRIYGNGPAVVLFHPSPNSSKMMHAFALLLAEHFTVICPDTPGYGFSEKLEQSNPTMTDYVACFQKAFSVLGLEMPAIYGSATGGQLAIRYALEYPDAVSHIFLDNCAHFTDDERASILKSYFPDLRPKMDGSHLILLWEMVSNLFKYFPWCFQDEEHKLKVPSPPIELLHAIAMDYLRAGPDYYLAYKAAFHHEKVEYIQQLKIPTTILRWQGSILKKYTDRIFEYDLNPNIGQKTISADRANRFSEMSVCIQENYNSDSHYDQSDLAGFTKDNIRTVDTGMQMSIPAPSPQLSGEYLLAAWSSLCKNVKSNDVTSNLSDINQQLIQWYS